MIDPLTGEKHHLQCKCGLCLAAPQTAEALEHDWSEAGRLIAEQRKTIADLKTELARAESELEKLRKLLQHAVERAGHKHDCRLCQEIRALSEKGSK